MNYLLVKSKKLGHYILSQANETILVVTKGLAKPFLARSAREFFPSAAYCCYHLARLWATVFILFKLSLLIFSINGPSNEEVLIAVLGMVWFNIIYRVTKRLFNKN